MQAMLGKSRMVRHGKTASTIGRVNTPRTATSGLNISENTHQGRELYSSHANTLLVSSGRVNTSVGTHGKAIQTSGSMGGKKRYQSASKYSKSGAALHMNQRLITRGTKF